MPCTGCIDSQSAKIANRLASPEEVGLDGDISHWSLTTYSK